MRINKILLGIVTALVLILAALVSYRITVNRLGGKAAETGNNQTSVQENTGTTAAQESGSTTPPAENTAENTETTVTSENTSETTAAAQTTAIPAAQTQSGIEPLPTPTVVTVNDETWNLTLMNKWYKIDAAYTPKLAEAVEGSGVYLDYRVAQAYSEMYKAAAAEGVELYPCSGYRSIDRQTRNYNNLVTRYVGEGYSQAEAEAIAAQSIMVPGQSEHNYGLAMDIGWISNDFANSSAYAWLSKHAAEYGFIERYKKEKMSITGVYEEPWHWRYVGESDAAAINASGKCLEEYLGLVN